MKVSPSVARVHAPRYDRRVRELRPGLWHWTASHPEWREGEPWDQNVSSYAADDGEHLLVFDPIAPPSEIEELAAERTTAIVLTCPWHERDAQGLVERLGVPVYTPSPDTAEDLLRIYDFTAPEGWISPDVRWLVESETGEAHWYAAGDRLPGGVDAFPGQKRNDVVLWAESHGAIVSGDTLVDFGDGLQLNDRWLRQQGLSRGEVIEGLRPLLELPVEHVLAAHGGPFDRAALERALS
jgi:glyoxylase-like metal-dependent hydrolase (beta-lactamase superfamily II)